MEIAPGPEEGETWHISLPEATAAPRSTTVRKPATPRTTTAKKPATPRKSPAPRKPAATRNTATKKTAATEKDSATPASEAAEHHAPAAPKPVRKPSASRTTAPKKPTATSTTTASTGAAGPKAATARKAPVAKKPEPKDAVRETQAAESAVATAELVKPEPLTAEPVETKQAKVEIIEVEPLETEADGAKAPVVETSVLASTQAALSTASAWAKRVATASSTRVSELRESLAVTMATRLAKAEALAELAKTAESPDVETSVSASVSTLALDVMLSVTGLTKRFDDTLAVAGIDLTVKTGDFYGIVGPNGAGKTTTLSMITGLLRPDSGTVIVHGSDVWNDPLAAKRSMGVLPDRLRLFDRLTGAQLLYYAGILRGMDKDVVRKRSADLAEAFGLEEAMGRLVTDYSAGMTKKVALAAAMIHSPRMLVLDEPFESVDPVSAATVTDILKKYAAAGGTVVLSSHSMDMVQRVCDHVAVVVDGEILADGTVDEVRAGKSLEERFIELTGGPQASEGLQWLNSFSS